jgi:hypothetical protein
VKTGTPSEKLSGSTSSLVPNFVECHGLAKPGQKVLRFRRDGIIGEMTRN